MPKNPMYVNVKGTPGAVYVYIGDGFIPGLAREITMEDAELQGLLEELKAAIANGSYVVRARPMDAAPRDASADRSADVIDAGLRPDRPKEA